LQGASAIQEYLEENPGAPVSVFVVWEPVLFSDWIGPTSGTLRRLHDRRGSQLWDRGRLLSSLIHESVRADSNNGFARCSEPGHVVWDVVAVFPPGGRWESRMPSPSYCDGAVVGIMDGFRKHMRGLAVSAAGPG